MSRQASLSSFFGGVGKKRKIEEPEIEPAAKRAKVETIETISESITTTTTVSSDQASVTVVETTKQEIISQTLPVQDDAKSDLILKEIEWRNTLPPHVKAEKLPKATVTLQTTQQAGKYLKSKYVPIPELWKIGEPVPYLAVSRVLNSIEGTTKRLEITELYSQFLRCVIANTPSDLLRVVYLCTNQVAPSYAGIELGIGESLLMKAIAESTQGTLKSIKALYQKKGDLGTVARECRSAQRTLFKPKQLTVKKVYDTFLEIALMKGHSSTARKVEKIKGLLIACSEYESTYIIRALQGKLRIGLAAQTVLIAISHAFYLTPPRPLPLKDELIEGDHPFVLSLDTSRKISENQLQTDLIAVEALVKQSFCQLPSFELMIPQLLAGNLLSLTTVCPLTPGIPLKPMLAHPTKGVHEVLTKFENITFTCEYKYDGERAQIHYLPNGEIKIYSRNAEDNTEKYPDLIQLVPQIINPGTASFVLDSEVVAFDVTTQRILPFQVLSTRGKKSVKEEDLKVQVCLFGFDLLYINGRSILKEPFQKRREELYSGFKEVPGRFQFATHMETDNVENLEAFLNKSVEDLCEGLMVKTLVEDASYEPAKRSLNWLKLKKDYLNDMGDSLDLVCIGGYRGRGKRTGVYGGFLLACYDPENEEYQSICKIGTGFSDADLAEFSVMFAKEELDTPPSYYRVPERDHPSVYFPPVTVFEVKAADLSISPNHKAAIGLVDPNKGISLRFPRFIRIRDDKTPEDATDAEQVAAMYNNQANKQAGATIAEDEDW